MKSSSRGLFVKHLTETELNCEIEDTQKADETRLVRWLCFVNIDTKVILQKRLATALASLDPRRLGGRTRG